MATSFTRRDAAQRAVTHHTLSRNCGERGAAVSGGSATEMLALPLTAPSKHFREVLVDVEQVRVGLCLEVDVEQGHDRLKTLRVDHRPLLERDRSQTEDELEMRGSTTP
jgi:hypothetical protein